MEMALAASHDNSRLIACRQCHAPPWAPCRDTVGRSLSGPSSAYTHLARREDWAHAPPVRL